ncbi:MAG: hypothetical protein HQL43_01855 [Alphaproteobacteria bacterium]|nr:hypothetical protein [Alphaproteobacteria bacterium]
MRKMLLAAGLLALSATTANAERFPPITDQVVLKECGSCHNAFYPEMLQKSVWQEIMSNLKDHYGEDATITNEATKKHILDFHLTNSADVTNTRQAGKWMEGVTTPAKAVTLAPRFVRKHSGIKPEIFKVKGIDSKANCAACHSGYVQGTFEDNEFTPIYRQSVQGR